MEASKNTSLPPVPEHPEDPSVPTAEEIAEQEQKKYATYAEIPGDARLSSVQEKSRQVHDVVSHQGHRVRCALLQVLCRESLQRSLR